LSYAACLGMASGQCLYNQSVYLLSETGLGKSHLSHAVGNYLLSSKPETRGPLRDGRAVCQRDDQCLEKREHGSFQEQVSGGL